MSENLINLSEEILQFLLRFKEHNPDFTFSLRQRDSAQTTEVKRMESGQWFQGSHYIYVPLFKKGDTARKIKTIGFVVNFEEDEFDNNYIEISFKAGDFTEEEKQFHTALAESIQLPLNENRHGTKGFPEEQSIFENLSFYINEFRDRAINLLKDYGIFDKYIISEDQFQKDLQKISTIREKLYPKTQKMANQIINLLRYKKQIILQGPPGTGKTRLAKEIAQELVRPLFITVNDIKSNIKVGQTIVSSYDKIPYKVTAVTETGITLQLVNGSSQTRNYDHIIKAYSNILEGKSIGGGETYQTAIARYLYDIIVPDTQFKIIQFHPSYSYEDFVRGIVAKPNPDGEGMLYEAENKTLGAFAKQAYDNYLASPNSGSDNNLDLWVNEKFEDFKNIIEQDTEKSEVTLSGEITIFKVEHDNFRYGKGWATPSRINFSDFKKLIKAIAKNQLSFTSQQIPKELSVHAHYRNTYYMALLKKFDDKYQYKGEAYSEPLKNFVLIIDEINRANLSSVLGELIYALEYRGEKVESMYDADGKDLVLPPNLYIIGTMNTADRSVGHIDYAIRRRFAFVDVLPKDLTTELPNGFKSDVFKKVADLFVKNYDAAVDYANPSTVIEKSEFLTADFEPKDVWLGHSYFIQQYEKDAEGNDRKDHPIDFSLRLRYEIKPILEEYIKDGILKEGARKTINEL